MSTRGYDRHMTPSSAPRRNSAGLKRDLEILELLGSPESEQNGGLGVVRLAELVARDKGQVSRTLATLAESGLVARDPVTLTYRLGYQLYALAARTAESRLVRESAPFLRRVVGATHETTHLCVLRGGSVLTLSSELSEHAFRGIAWEGVSVAAWRTSAGRVLVSDWTDDAIREWYEVHGHDRTVVGPISPVMQASGGIEPAAEGQPLITDYASLLAEVRRIRRRGFATVDEEFEMGVVGASAPVYDARGGIIAAINLSAPKARIGRHLDQVGGLVAEVASELSRHLGAPERERSSRTP